jgi:5'-nucleotidase/UDP-sugar diphosphatase
MRHRLPAALGILFLLPTPALAQQLEIIHTNDLHSYIDHADDNAHGSYAAVKAIIDNLKAQYSEQGIDMLTLDAGDFSEGTPFYMAGNGTDSWRIMQEMGYDAIAIGNHDWLVGPAQMNAIAQAVQPTTPLLSANLHVDARFTALRKFIQPHAEFTRAGLKIAVVGLSTDEILYSWRITDGHIDPPNQVMQSEVKALRSNNDLVIGLTHIGVDADVDLAKNVSGVDLIVGGHSHTVLPTPVIQNNPQGIPVPIVQTGAHGNYVGDLLIDYEPGKPVKVLHYQLIPVLKNGPQDPEIANRAIAEEEDFDQKYTDAWLDTVLGYTDIPLENPENNPTRWGNFYVDSIREAASADMGIDSSEFFGSTQPSGPITRRTVMNFYPRYFDLNRPLGWNVWTLHIPGWLIAVILDETISSGSFFNLSNCTYDVDLSSGSPKMTNLQIGGKSIDPLKVYTVAVTEGIGLGAKEIADSVLSPLFWPSDTGIPVWTAVEEKLRQGGGAPELTKALPSSFRWHAAKMDRFARP